MEKWRYCSLTLNLSTTVGERLSSCVGTFTPRIELLVPIEVGNWSCPRDGVDTLEKRKISYRCSKLKHSVSVVQSVALSLYQLSYLASHLFYIGLKSGLCVSHVLFNRFYCIQWKRFSSKVFRWHWYSDIRTCLSITRPSLCKAINGLPHIVHKPYTYFWYSVWENFTNLYFIIPVLIMTNKLQGMPLVILYTELCCTHFLMFLFSTCGIISVNSNKEITANHDCSELNVRRWLRFYFYLQSNFH